MYIMYINVLIIISMVVIQIQLYVGMQFAGFYMQTSRIELFHSRLTLHR